MNAAAEPENMLHEQPLGTAHLRIVALCFLAWIFDFYDLVLYSFLLVPIAKELHLSPAGSSLALGTSLLMTAAGGIIFGFIGDRFGRKPAIVATVTIYGIGTLLCAASHSLAQLIVYRSITGLGVGGGWAPGQSLVAESVPADRRARYGAYVQTGAPLGILLAAAVSGYVAPAIGWRATFALSALPAFPVVIAVMRFLPESDVWIRGGKSHLGLGQLRALLPYRQILTLLFITLLLNSEAYWFTYTWMPGYLELKRGLSAAGAGRLVICMQIGGVIGYAIFGLLADRFGRRPMFFLFGMVMAAGLLPPTILWTTAVQVRGLIAMAMFAVGFGTGLWSGVAPMISEMIPTRVRNTALGLLLNVSRGLQFFTPIFISAMGSRVGFGRTLALGAVFSAAGAAMVWTLPETRGREITALDAN
ncbi:MAG: MFS transporter [Candidatus Binataceae bacterium]